MRRLAEIGLWWQAIVWEWASLDIWDVLAGYGVIAAILGFMILLVGVTLIRIAILVGIVILALGVVPIVAAGLGWRRKGRKYARRSVKTSDSDRPSR